MPSLTLFFLSQHLFSSFLSNTLGAAHDLSPHPRAVPFSVPPSSQPPSASWLPKIQFCSLMARKSSCFHPMFSSLRPARFLHSFQADVSKFCYSYSSCLYISLFLFLQHLPQTSNFSLCSLLTEDHSFSTCLILSQSLDSDLIMNPSFWSLNLQIPFLWGTAFLTCHSAAPFLMPSQLPSPSRLTHWPSAHSSHIDTHSYSIS